ncbi:ABC transporter permease [Vibrio sp. Y2-5]|uniref:ABC transporter permease n=1 Tax=Vibrio TaxID=662 RepID=UPI0016617CDB|nr:ABC transporter permease [Vibrio sp. Y2-5]MBD0787954.1 ABC transporter permease [Vibrio sp. Y2-5]
MKTLAKNYSLIISLTKRDIEERYRSSSLGLLWSIALPLFMLAIYTFVFSFVFKSKWGVDTNISYSLVMFIGLITHAFYSECLGKATGLIHGNANYVKKVIFPLQILCWVSLLSSFFQFLISFCVFLLFYFVMGYDLQPSQLLVPFIVLPMIIMALALILFISALSVYVRDVSHIISVAISILLFLSPVFYSITSVPEKYRWLIYLNPITYAIECLRDVVIYGRFIDVIPYALYFLVCVISYFLASKWFNKLKVGFADVI